MQPFNPDLVIIPEEKFRKVQDIMDKRNKKSGAASESRVPLSSKVLLSGLAVCGYCGKKLKASYSPKKNIRKDGSVHKYINYKYECHHAKNNPEGHKQRQFGAVSIDRRVEEEVLEAIKSIKLDAFNAEKDAFDFEQLDARKMQLKELEKQYEETSKALANVEKLFDDVMTGKSNMSLEFVAKKMDEYGARKIDLLSKIDQLKEEIKEAEVTSSDLDKLKHMLEDWVDTYKNATTIEQKKAMMAQVLREVVISKEAIVIKFNITVQRALEGSFEPDDNGARDAGYTIPCETDNNPHKHVTGAISMAHRGRDTGSCQFFIVHEPQPHLDGVHTVFGQVTSGMDVVKSMKNGDVMKEVKVFDEE